MSYSKVKRYFPAGVFVGGAGVGTFDISDASDTTEFTWVPKDNCKIYGFGGLAVEATGTQTTTAGVCSLVVGSTEKATFTAAISAAIGTEVLGSHFAPINVPIGTSVIFKVKTQAVGGTVVGEYAGFLYVEFFPALAGV